MGIRDRFNRSPKPLGAAPDQRRAEAQEAMSDYVPQATMSAVQKCYGVDSVIAARILSDYEALVIFNCKPFVDALKHLIYSNHGFKPDSCRACAHVQRLAGERP